MFARKTGSVALLWLLLGILVNAGWLINVLKCGCIPGLKPYMPALAGGVAALVMAAATMLLRGRLFLKLSFITGYLYAMATAVILVQGLIKKAALANTAAALFTFITALALVHATHARALPWQALPAWLKNWRWAKHQRRWYGKWHLYLGLFAGAITCVLGLTGSILVFQDEIDRALNPELVARMEHRPRIPLYEIPRVVREKYPRQPFSYVTYTDKDNPVSTYRFMDVRGRTEFFVNPYTGVISKKRLLDSSFIRILINIHTSLLVPVAGKYIVGLSALCLLVLTISGLRLWLPEKLKQLRAALTVKFSAGFKRQNLDWHNVIGLYTAPIVAVLSLTGMIITFNAPFIAVLFMLTGKSPNALQQVFGKKSVYHAGAKAMPLSKVYGIVKDNFSYATLESVMMPADSTGVYMLYFRSAGPAKSGNLIMTAADQYSGKLLLNSDKDFPPVGHTYLNFTVPLHYGTFGGMPTRILALLGGLAPLALYITGFIIWWPRLKKQKGQSARPKRKAKEALPPLAPGKYYSVLMGNGVKYASIMALCALAFGVLYGAAGGVVLQPAVYLLIYMAIAIILNFVIALAVLAFQTLMLLPFGKHYRLVYRYFVLSLAFVLVFMPAAMIFIKFNIVRF